ncbi:MAG: Gfo/Idh/MocA family oxidoreductase [bacterium]
MNRLRVGFVGCGSHATLSILPSLRFAPIDLVTVCDLQVDRAEYAARVFGAGDIASSAEELIARDDLDAVFVVGPPKVHTAVAIQAMQAGKHVFSEKPPGETLQAALEMQRVSRETGQHCFIAFMKRFSDNYVTAKKLMSEDFFGRPSQILARYAHWNQNTLRDHLVYMSVHLIDLARFFMGDYVRVVAEKNVLDGQHSFSISARFSSGAVGSLISSAQQPRVQERVEISGERALIVVDNIVNLEVHRSARNGIERRFDMSDIEMYRPDFSIPCQNQNSLVFQGYVGEVVHFAESILAGRAPSPNIDDGVAAMRIVDWLERGAEGVLELENMEES